MLYFAAHHLGTLSGVMVTGSHNPPEYNGLKMMLAGDTLAGEAIQGLRRASSAVTLRTGAGGYRTADITADYSAAHRRRREARAADEDRRRLRQRRRRRVRAGALSPARLRGDRALLRGGRHFPQPPSRSLGAGESRRPDQRRSSAARPKSASPSTATATGSAWSRKRGEIIYPDRQLMLFAADVLSRNPGATKSSSTSNRRAI